MKTEQILERLEKVEKRVEEMEDSTMTEEDYQALIDYRKQKAEGKLISHGQLKNELNGNVRG